MPWHPSTPPQVPKELVPGHVAIVMDGNGRWAKDRGLPRTKGHEQGESGREKAGNIAGFSGGATQI